MSNRRFTGIAAAAVTATVFFTAAALPAAADAPIVDISPVNVQLSPKGAIGDVFSFGKKVYDKYKTCKANIAIGVPCLNKDGDNIRLALQELKAIERKMESNQDDLLERLGELDVSLNESRVEAYLRDLRAVEMDGTLAMQAWAALSDCVDAKSSGVTECASFLDEGRTRIVPVDTGITENQQTFLFYADQLPRDLASTVATYTGTKGSGDRYSLSYALWRLAKVRLDMDADVRSTAIRKSQFTPFVTPRMAKDVNEYLDYYLDVFSLYGNVLETRALILRDGAQELGNATKAAAYQLEADRIAANIDRRILATSADSVNGIKEVYQLSPLETGDIMMANSSGTGVIIYAAQRKLAGDRSMRSSDVSILGQGLKNYGSFSKLAAAQPAAFPSDKWYEVTASVMKLSCSEPALNNDKVEVTMIANHPQPSLVARGVETQSGTVRMKLLDERPAWNNDYATSRLCVNHQYGAIGTTINFDLALGSNAPWPATFDWKKYDYPGYRPFGFGAYLDVPVSRNLNRVSEEQSDNKMVRWPEGFTPTMPAGY